MYSYKHKINLCLLGILTLSAICSAPACRKLAEVNSPITSTSAASVYTSDETAAAVLTGIYAKMSQNSSYAYTGPTTLSLFAGLSADEFTLFNGASNVTQLAYYKNDLSVQTGGFEYWDTYYPYIFLCNAVIEGLTDNNRLTPTLGQQLIGEAKFLRAFCYFYLVNLFGDVPQVITTDYKKNAVLARTPKEKVYEQIISDLKDAQSLLRDDYVDGTATKVTEARVRPNKWAATALLARTYLYTGDWKNATAQASEIIAKTDKYILQADLNNVFLANNKEAIWQLFPVNSGINTEDAYHFIIPATGPSALSNSVYLSPFLLNSFESGDNRKSNWVDSVNIDNNTYYYPYKYKVNALNVQVTEYLMILRLAEQYLIRAEAYAQLGQLQEAVADLNTIRTRAGLPGIAVTTQSALLTTILHERQVELFTELGHRWLDLKRTGTVDEVMSIVTPAKGGTWRSTQQLYPLPPTEIQSDINLQQNTGY